MTWASAEWCLAGGTVRNGATCSPALAFREVPGVQGNIRKEPRLLWGAGSTEDMVVRGHGDMPCTPLSASSYGFAQVQELWELICLPPTMTVSAKINPSMAGGEAMGEA